MASGTNATQSGGGLDRRLWEGIAAAVTSQTVMLRDATVLDDAIAAAVLSALDGVRRGQPENDRLSSLVVEFDQRLESLTAVQGSGAGTLARGRADTSETALRIALRSGMLDLLAAAVGLRLALLDLADDHVFTLMPAYGQGRPLQPTSLAHLLGGVISPLSRATARLRAGFAEVNRSPMGAVALASTGFAIDREAVARRLGFDGPAVSTFDAIAAVDHLSAALDPVTALAAAVGRFLRELQTWLRAEPGSVRLQEVWLADIDPSLTQFRPAARVNRLVADSDSLAADAAVAVRLAGAIPYGPNGGEIDGPAARTLAILDRARDLLSTTTELIATGLEINRAHFASRAGRGHVTTGELAALLIEQEHLNPGAARKISEAVARDAADRGLEASGITPEAIDAAAMATIGRELGIEIERLGAYLAPRRFLERRTALGAPSPASTREWIEFERTRVLADERWRDETASRIRDAVEGMEREAALLLGDA